MEVMITGNLILCLISKEIFEHFNLPMIVLKWLLFYFNPDVEQTEFSLRFDVAVGERKKKN